VKATWSRGRTLVAGLLLIAGTNAVVLGGVGYNRGGEPEAALPLTERELQISDPWGWRSENSGLDLRLQWRLPPTRADVSDYGQGGYGGGASWLDGAKLAKLGFDMSVPLDERGAERHYAKQLAREVLIVLELDGPAHQAAIERARERASREKATKADAELLAAEIERHSRLFAVDAGIDRDALRAKYPDRARYAIAPGKVRLGYWGPRGERTPRGYVSELSVPAINVPLEMRGVVTRGGPYTATVAFGRRLEPWLAAAGTR
jgi:hypothetical protein